MERYDVVTFGETMLRFSPPGLRRIEQATAMEVEVGGSESNVAIALARLGFRTLWLSRLTANPLGRLIEQQVARHGVDTSQVVWTEEGRVGLYFLEEGRPPRQSRVVYDRAGSAFSQMEPHELPETPFLPGAVRHLHLSGITPAVGPGPAATARRALELARVAGASVSFDLNYRRLWSLADAREGCDFFMREADLLFVPLSDARLLYGLADEPAEGVLAWLAARYGQATIVLTVGSEGALARDPAGEHYRQPAFRAEPVGRVGGGDAFAAGFLYATLTDAGEEAPLARALRWAAAAAALKYTVPGDIPFIERAEIEALLSEPPSGGGLVR